MTWSAADYVTFENLSLENFAAFQGEDPVFAQYENDRDAHAFAAQWAAFSRASVFPTLAAALTTGPVDQRRATFMERLEAAMIARLATQPQAVSIPLVRMVIVRNA